ncbi:sugar ABC transporter ATP-binding protein [Microbacterium jepli]|uniref:sugar ABC transporter ATP-binding protein n=1 Tax=Microbacterium sp. 1P10UE TaxID=3132288 RepID=UPI0039A22CC9
MGSASPTPKPKPKPKPPALRVSDLRVDFPGVRALDRVSLDVRSGEVLALVGENGAGKSTLLKVLGGVQRPTGGQLELRGEQFRPRHPSAAIDAGLAVIYQEFTLFPHLTVAENVFIGREPRHRAVGGIDYSAMRESCRNLFHKLGVEIHPDALVTDLSVSEQQLVEIARALQVDGDVIVMDEPTAALSRTETSRLLDIVRQLRSDGKAVVFVSHHLEEVFAIADRIVVLRDGRKVAERTSAETDPTEIVQLMVGREVTVVARRESNFTDTRFEMRAVSAGPLREIDLHICTGEILGVGGVAGAGQPELSRVIFGDLPLRSGEMTLAGATYLPSSPRSAMRLGVGFLHEDRKSAGNFNDLSVAQNATITILDRVRGVFGLLSPAREGKVFEEYRRRLRIKSSSPAGSIAVLSGGNQQKVLLARAVAQGNRLLVLNEPTRGVDVGGKAEIHQLVRELADGGGALTPDRGHGVISVMPLP